MAQEIRNTAPQAASKETTGAAKGRGKRVSRAEKGLPELTPVQKQQRAMVQQAQNSCTFIKQAIDSGKPIKAEVLQACSILSGSLASMIGE